MFKLNTLAQVVVLGLSLTAANAADLSISELLTPVKDGTGRFASLTVRATRGKPSRVSISGYGTQAENNSARKVEELTVTIPGGDKLVFSAAEGSLKTERANTFGDWKSVGTLKVTEGSYKVIFIDRSRNEYENFNNSATIQFIPLSKEEKVSEVVLR